MGRDGFLAGSVRLVAHSTRPASPGDAGHARNAVMIAIVESPAAAIAVKSAQLLDKIDLWAFMPAHALSGELYTALVAEDEVIVRMVAVDALIDAGFRVLEAEHAGAALQVLEEHGRSVHILITDVHMPGTMNGIALAHHTCRHWPWIALLIASAHPHPGHHELPPGSRFLPKPYFPHHLVGHARELVGAG